MPRGVHSSPRGRKPGPPHSLKSIRLPDELWAALGRVVEERMGSTDSGVSVNDLVREYCQLGVGNEQG